MKAMYACCSFIFTLCSVQSVANNKRDRKKSTIKAELGSMVAFETTFPEYDLGVIIVLRTGTFIHLKLP